MLLSALICFFLILSPRATQPASQDDFNVTYERWKQPNDHYYLDIHHKMNVILHGGCDRSSYRILSPNEGVLVPNTSSVFYVFLRPPRSEDIAFWRSIPSPKEMRNDPLLCAAAYTKKHALFKKDGCNLPHYMGVSHPRCQSRILAWSCKQAAVNDGNATYNDFRLLEAQHTRWRLPPTPYLIIARDALVNMCGQLVLSCGFVHTNTNCRAPGDLSRTRLFRKTCPHPLEIVRQQRNTSSQVSLNASGASLMSGNCSTRTPYSSEYVCVHKLFVLAQVMQTNIPNMQLSTFNLHLIDHST